MNAADSIPSGLAKVSPALRGHWLLRCQINLLAVCLFVAAAVWATYPLAWNLDSALPLGSESTSTVPLFNLWTVWWNADRLEQGLPGLASYWEAPIFAPLARTFALSEPQPPTMFVAPLVWQRDSPELAYNLYLLVSLVLNGWSGYRLLWQVGTLRILSILGGGMIVLLPFVHWQLGVLQLVPLWGVLWTLTALVRYSRKPKVAFACELGVAYGLTFLLCGYYGLFVSLPLVAFAPWVLRRHVMRLRSWLHAVIAMVIAAALIAPVAWPQLQVTSAHQFTRKLDYISQQSAKPRRYLVANWVQLTERFGEIPQIARARNGYSSGWIKYGLAVIGILALLPWPRRRSSQHVEQQQLSLSTSRADCVDASGERRDRLTGQPDRNFSRWWIMAVVSFGGLSCALSLGPHLSLDGFQPYTLLVKHLPGFEHARNVYRFAVFVQLAVVFLAVAGLQWLWRWGARFDLSGPILVPVVVLGLVATFEIVPPTQRLHSLDWERQAHWLQWIEENTEPNDIFAYIPFPTGSSAAAYEQTAHWMVWGTRHGRPMVNGYSGYFPESFFVLKGALPTFPDENSLSLLQGNAVKWCVVQSDFLSPGALQRDPYASKYLEWQYTDYQAKLDIYKLNLTAE